MTKEEYRQHMRQYSATTMTCSFVQTKHPDYDAMKAAGKEIIPFLLEDVLDTHWYCNACHGYGYQFEDGWHSLLPDQQLARPWPPVTSTICPECKGKGAINSWAAMMLLAEAAGSDRPFVENRFRGRHDALVKVWKKWGEDKGYLPKTPESPASENPGMLQSLFGGLLKKLTRS